MNIFILDEDPEQAAIAMCDKHVPKMVLESAQLLCSAFHQLSSVEDVPYRLTHKNHPCTKWVRQSQPNYEWLLTHARSLLNEYTFRFSRIHACTAVVQWCADENNRLVFPSGKADNFVQALPVELKRNSAVEAYRLYYSRDKRRFAKWQRGRSQPVWWNNED